MNIFEKMQAVKAEREAREGGAPPDTKGTTLIERMNAAKAAAGAGAPALAFKRPQVAQGTSHPTKITPQVATAAPTIARILPAASVSKSQVASPEELAAEAAEFGDFDMDAEAIAEDMDEFDEAFLGDEEEGEIDDANVAEISVEEEAPPRKSLAIPRRPPAEKLETLEALTNLGIVTEEAALPLPAASESESTSSTEPTSQPEAQATSAPSRGGLTLPSSQPTRLHSEPLSDSTLNASSPAKHGLSLPGSGKSGLHLPPNVSPVKPSVSSPQKPLVPPAISRPATQNSVLPTVKSSGLPTQASAPSTEPAATATPAVNIAAGSPLGKLLERRNVSTERPVSVSAGALSCISASGGVAVYSPQQFLEDWNSTNDDDEGVNETRAELVRKVSARLQQIYSTEMEKLTASVASIKTMEEITMLVKLTFLRVRDCEHAWTVLDRMDRGAVIQGMALMAQKRNSAVRSRKPREATAMSNALEDMVSGGLSIEDVLGEQSMDDFNFGIEGL